MQTTADAQKIMEWTIPSSGIWIFAANKIWASGRPSMIQIKVDGTDIASIEVDGNGKDYSHIKVCTVRECNINSKVQVWGKNTSYSNTNTHYVAFVAARILIK